MSSALLPKPLMRGLLANRLRKHLIILTALSFGLITGFKYTVIEPRKRTYAEFYKNYDAEKECEAMIAAGIFQSAPLREE